MTVVSPDDLPVQPQASAAVTAAPGHWLRVVLDVPLFAMYDYKAAISVPIGTRVIVPFGRRKAVGVVIERPAKPAVAPDLIKEVDQVLDDTPALSGDWLRLANFAAAYYQRPLGEVMLPALPASLRKVSAYQGKRSGGGPVARLDRRRPPAAESVEAQAQPKLNQEQQAALEVIQGIDGPQTILLYGVTGSGKTEVYVRAIQKVLEAGRQVLFLVPEINLTPQLERALRGRLKTAVDEASLAVLHSGLSEGERLRAWLQAQRGEARVLLGTRLAIFASLPQLGLIVVDEEHDTSYKQQDGLRYSARDLAVWRARDKGVPVILGSATPSLESWKHAQSGRYLKVSLTRRAKEVALPAVRLVDTRRLALEQGFSPQLLQAIEERLAGGQQVLIFLNRRGYAPVLNCASCGWVSQCVRCTAFTVLHRGRGRHHFLQCHHCGYQAHVPRACPECGDQDLKPLGRGTQRVEEFLAQQFPEARIARIDADSTRRKGSAARLFEQVHAGEFNLLVGTQMVAKGHDFVNLGLVGVLNADAMLFAQDFRAPERLFAQLMQVAGRAGRHNHGAEVIIQSEYPDQPVYRALVAHDYVGFADHALAEREAVGLPPYAWQALLVAEARELSAAVDFLKQACALPQNMPQDYATADAVSLYDPVPLRVVRVANIERAQLLVECTNRPALQAFLATWSAALGPLARRCKVRYTLEVDPLEI